jgi:hypothetical protein
VELIAWNIWLALTIEEPALLSCHALVIDILFLVCISSASERLLDCIAPKKVTAENLLLLVGEGKIRALNVDAILPFLLSRFLIRSRSQTDKEPQSFIAVKVKEVFEREDYIMTKGIDVVL